MLTEAFDEADDTGPAPLSWHLHGENSHTETNGKKNWAKAGGMSHEQESLSSSQGGINVFYN